MEAFSRKAELPGQVTVVRLLAHLQNGLQAHGIQLRDEAVEGLRADFAGDVLRGLFLYVGLQRVEVYVDFVGLVDGLRHAVGLLPLRGNRLVGVEPQVIGFHGLFAVFEVQQQGGLDAVAGPSVTSGR